MAVIGSQPSFLVAAVVAVIAALVAKDLLLPLVSWSLALFFGLAGFILGVAMVICTGKRYTPPTPLREPLTANLLLIKMVEARFSFNPAPRNVVMSKNLDLTVQEIMDYITRDYIMSWYDDLGKDGDRFKQLLHGDIWYVLERFCERLSAISHVRFVAQDVTTAVYKHFQNIRIASVKPVEGEQKAKFILPPWLVSDVRELEYIRKVAAVFCLHLLPPEYATCAPARHLLTEILACKVFKPAVDLICDPDYINQKLFGWLQYREQLSIEHKRTYTYAATYEDFMQMIETCSNIEHLREMRYNIISEIMQATTIQNLKRARGLDTDRESSPKGTTKGDLLRARNLTRYINQLTVTKSHCEKRIYLLGGPDYKSYTSDTRREEQQQIPGRKVLSFRVVMDKTSARSHFMKYLHRGDNDALLRFWISIEKLRHSSRHRWHELASDAYQMFIIQTNSAVRLQLDRTTIKGMEAFMLGNTGPDAFYEAQQQIYQILEEKFYPSFIVSDIYHRYITQSDENDTNTRDEDSEVRRTSTTPEKDEAAYKIAEHSTYAQQKLRALDEKIGNKTQALQALKHTQKPDRKIMLLQKSIEEEIEHLRVERHQLEFHIDRTEVWLENIGHWKAHIYNTEVIQEESGMVPYFVIVVHLTGVSSPKDKHPGWVVSRRLSEFHELHAQLIQIFPELKKRQLPNVSKLRFRSIGTDFLNKAKENLEDYLTSLLKNERAAQSQAAFSFFSPSPEHLKFPSAPSKKAKFSLANLLPGLSSQNQDSDSDDDFIFIDAESMKEERVNDSVAKPLYLLLNEVFELRGMFKWLRRTLMVFVKVSFGRSINRQLRDLVEWVISEPMLIFYLTQFKDAYWPNGELAEASPLRTAAEKLETRMLAKEKFLAFGQEKDALKNLFGEQNARNGTIKLFEAMQDIRLNKHLFYELLELFLYESFPELKASQEQPVPSPPPPRQTRQPVLIGF